MEIKIDFTKNAQDNANDYYGKSKKLLVKKEGAKRAVKELEASLKKLEGEAEAKREKKAIKVREKKWYEKFHWFFTSDGKLVIGGRDAHQNELLNGRHFDDGDLFFHADIFGASVTILKEGREASAEAKEEAAQFAASYSSAWKNMEGSVDVYAMRREQVSKSTSKGSIGTGSFLLSGEREWFRNTQLALVMFVEDGVLNAVPLVAFNRLLPSKSVGSRVFLKEGKAKKSDAAKVVANVLSYDNVDEIMQQLPAGTFQVSKT